MLIMMVPSLTILMAIIIAIIFFTLILRLLKYDGRTESHEQHFFACELGTADEGECGGRWNQLLC